ncbi:GGDEF domain-containing protein [Vibrio chaetopteri]|uniref:GGDEF domain-containing protein n=1 Tax=Vibrio chaetopteri TaxID=3016528 RepID=A0AAU8BE24_9VIBR
MHHLVVIVFSTALVVINAFPSAHAASTENKTFLVSAHERDFLARFIFSTIESQSNFHFKYVAVSDFTERLNAVENRKLDFISNITFTKARSKRFIFSPPINIEPTYLFTQSGQSFDELSVIGTTMGTAFNDIIQRYYPEKRVLSFNDNDVVFESMRSGDIDGFIGTFLQLEWFLNAGFKAALINDRVSIPPVSIITNKPENAPLLAKFSQIISQDTVQKQIRSYIESYITNIAIKQLKSDIESSGLDLSAPLEVHLNHRKPYVYQSQDGRVQGVAVELVKEVCRLGSLQCELVYEPNKAWAASLQKLMLAEHDVMTPIADLKHRKKHMIFSRPFASIDGVIAKRVGFKEEVYRHISELFAERVGVVENDVFATITRRLLPNKELVYFKDTEAMVRGLIAGTIDYAVTNRVTLNTLLYEQVLSEITEDHYFKPFYQSQLSFGFPKSERGETLAKLFNRTLDFVDTEAIHQKYQPPANWRELNKKELDKKRLNIINVLLGLFILVTIVFGYLTNHRANHDALTKLKNRYALNRIRKQSLGKGNGLIYIDLNGFKQINDTYGHTVGDQVLRCYAKLLRQTVKGTSYRIGGDEFVAITPLNRDKLSELLPRLESFDFKLRGQDETLQLHAAVGVFLPDSSELSIKQLLIYTDFAMYEAKRNQDLRSVIVDKAKLAELIEANGINKAA